MLIRRPRCKILALVFVCSLFGVDTLSSAQASVSLNTCIPDQSVPPFYLIKDNDAEGETIDRLKQLFRKPILQNIDFKLTLQPWQRCLLSLEKGLVDLIVAGYSEERASRGVFPDKMGFRLEHSAFSFTEICLLKRKDQNWSWNGKKIDGLDNLQLGLEPGFLIPDSHPLSSSIRYSSIWDISKKYEMVKMARVDAALTVCGVMGRQLAPAGTFPDSLEVIRPAFLSSPVYLLFSRSFYEKHTVLTSLIVETSNQLYLADIQLPRVQETGF